MKFSDIETSLAPKSMALEMGYKWIEGCAGKIIGVRLLRIGRDTPCGCKLRSHIYLGQELPALGKSPAEFAQFFPEELGIALFQRRYNNFNYLSRFLPSLHLAEKRQAVKPELPW